MYCKVNHLPGLTGDEGNPPSDSEEDKCLRRGIRNFAGSGLSWIKLTLGVVVPIGTTEEPVEASPNSTDLLKGTVITCME